MPSSDASFSEDDEDMVDTVEPSFKRTDSEFENSDDGTTQEEEEEEEEEEEDGEGERDEGEGEREEEKEGKEDGYHENGVDPLGSSSAEDEKRDDSSHEVEPGRNEENMGLDSSVPPEKSEATPPLDSSDVNDGSKELYSIGRPNELLGQEKDVSDVNDGDSKPSILGEHRVSSEENGFSNSLVDKEDVGALVGEKVPFSVKKDGNNARDCSKDPLNNSDSITADKTTFPCMEEKEVAVETLMRDGLAGEEHISSVEETKQRDVQSGKDLKLRTSSLPTQHLRPRSLSPGAEFEFQNKRPAVLCEFFAKGWCIKGSSCRFLHQSNGVDNSSNLAKGDMTVAGWKGEAPVNAGLRQDLEISRLSALHEPVSSSVQNNPPLESHFPSQRIISLEHGESQRWHPFHEEHRLSSLKGDNFTSGIIRDGSGPTSVSHHDFQQVAMTKDNPGRVSPFQDVGRGNLRQMDIYSRKDSPVTQGDFSKFDAHGRGWPFSSELQQTSSIREKFNHPLGIPTLNQNPRLLSDIPDNKGSVHEIYINGSPLARNSVFREYGVPSSGSVISSSMYGSSRASLSHDLFSPAHHAFALPGTSLLHGSSSTNVEPFGAQKLLESESGYHSSRSSSLPRIFSSPFYAKSEPQNVPLHSISGDPPVSSGYTTQSFASSWEPSVPFRPSFYFASSHILSPASQYDPLRDSIEPLNGGDRSSTILSPSQVLTIQNAHQPTNGEPVLVGNADKKTDKQSFSFIQQSHGIESEKITSTHGTDLGKTAAETTRICDTDLQNRSSMLKKEKASGPDPVVDPVNASEMDVDPNPRHQLDRGRHKKELKALKVFRAALVDFVKELVKPSWREGLLSKDAHNLVVKKAVDKVLSALQPHQIPNTTESIRQYLSSSRPKITKLVEGYVDKYAKP